MRRAAILALFAAGCFSPAPQDKGWRCDKSQNFLCPDGLRCDYSQGLCVKHVVSLDMGPGDLGRAFDFAAPPEVRSCDQKLQAGAFTNVTALTALNTAGDETSPAVAPDGKHIFFLSGGALFSADLTAGPKSPSAPSPVTITNGPATLNGGSFGADGTLWMSGTAATTQLYALHVDSPTALSILGTHKPETTGCAFSDPSLQDGDPAKELYVSYALAGCNDSRGLYLAQGGVDRQMGTFIGALPATGLRAPTILPGGLTLIFSTPDAHLAYATRAALDAQWNGPFAISTGLNATRDVQLAVGPSCKTVYIVAERTGGKGGLDLWAADVAAQ